MHGGKFSESLVARVECQRWQRPSFEPATNNELPSHDGGEPGADHKPIDDGAGDRGNKGGEAQSRPNPTSRERVELGDREHKRVCVQVDLRRLRIWHAIYKVASNPLRMRLLSCVLLLVRAI